VPALRPEKLFEVGQGVRTPYGRGVVKEVRTGGQVLVEIGQRTWRLDRSQVSASVSETRESSIKNRSSQMPRVLIPREPHGGEVELDLHGFTVQEALATAERVLNRALLDDVSSLRIIHGRSSQRIRAALHRWLREIPTVRSFRIDPRNEGVTIVTL
jgi:dsDNA-specific endonuclease/ATPase MutS2